MYRGLGKWTLKIAWEEARAIFSLGGSEPSQFLGQQIWARAVERGKGSPPSRVSTPLVRTPALRPNHGVSQPAFVHTAGPAEASWGEQARNGVGVLGWGKGSTEATFLKPPCPL